MKNKHLVLLFLGVLILGIASRWLPVRYRTFFETNLLRVDAADVSRMIVSAPGMSDLLFERIDRGWSVEQEDRTAIVPADTVMDMLELLANLASFQVVKTERPDTLGLAPDYLLRVRLFQANKLLENIEIGREYTAPDGSFTYLRLPGHTGIYRVPGRLRREFGRTLDDFRSKTVLAPTLDAVRAIGVAWPDSTTYFLEKNDSTGRWLFSDGPNSLSADSVSRWFQHVQRLNESPFADHFDESRESETLYAIITLETTNGRTYALRFFFLKPPDAPEDLASLRRRGVRALPSFVVHASSNPLNYFAVADTNLVHQLCHDLLRPKSAIDAAKK
jgi:hypothetical protein